MRRSYVLAGCHLLKDLAGIRSRVRFEYLKNRLMEEVIAAGAVQQLEIAPARHRYNCLNIWGYGEFRVGLAQWVEERGRYRWIFRMDGWKCPRQPVNLGILSEDNLRIETLALLLNPPQQKTAIRFRKEDIAETAIIRQTAAEIITAIVCG